MNRSLCILLALASALWGQPLVLETSIPLPGVEGRIDHLSIDVAAQRLYVAALGNNTVEVIDLRERKRAATIPGLSEPQGILFLPSHNRLFVANAHDGTVRLFDAGSLKQTRSVKVGEDADNVRWDAAAGRVFVGYGEGALAALTPGGEQDAVIKLDAHPESFQLEQNGPRVFVNLPGSHKVAVVDRKARSVTDAWSTGSASANYPMALDEARHRLFVVCRKPASLLVFDTVSGRRVATLATVGDCDDLFYDPRRSRLYAIGGEGAVAVIRQETPDSYVEIARTRTEPGARTGYFSPDLDRLYVAVRRQGARPAEIRVFRPGN